MLVEPWRVTLFGGLKAEQSGASVTRFRTRKAASLFAFLACHSQRDHAREELAERFWPDDAPEAARQKLRLALMSLRHQLEPQGTQAGTVLFADRTHLRLNAHAIETDVAAFESGLRAARSAPDAGARFELLARAIAWYAGDLLPGDYEEWAQQERERWKDAYTGALGQSVALGLELCRDEQAIDCARRLLAADPLQEDAHVALMRLYARAGRAGEALKQYQTLQSVLKDALGVLPGQEAQRLAAGLSPPGGRSSGSKAADSRSSDSKDVPASGRMKAPARPAAADQPASVQPTRAKQAAKAPSVASEFPHKRRTNHAAPARLPLFLTRCFGRENDIRVLAALLASPAVPAPDSRSISAVSAISAASAFDGLSASDTSLFDTRSEYAPRLVTLTGPGGAGKTRLAVEAAARVQQTAAWPIAFVPLADVTDPARICRAIADALCLPRVEGADTLTQIADCLHDAPALLVLDNFEQLTPGGADVVHALLARLPLLRCLVTSRHHLGLAGERAYPVPPLLPASGAQMFVDRAQSVRADFQITPRNAQAVSELCEQLEGIPLAIELCAAWSGALSPAQMLAKTRQRFDLLVSRRDDRVARHRALRAAIAWSYDLLPPDLRVFFTRLAVFQGGWTLEAAEAVCDTRHALHLLAQLRERSLVVVEESADGDMRFRLLESIREFALENLETTERVRVRRAHADCYTRLAEAAHGHLEGPEQAFWYACLEREHNNIRAALDACMQGEETGCREQETEGARMQGAGEAAQQISADSARQNDLEQSGTEQALRIALAMRLFWRARGYLSEGRRRLEAVLARPDAARFPGLLCVAQIEMGLLACTQGDTDEAREYLYRALPTARREGEERATASALNTLGNVALRLGEYEEAGRLYAECADLAQRVGYLRLYASALGNLGNVFWRQNLMEQARSHYEASLRQQRDLANKQGVLIALYNLGAMVGQMEDWDGSVTYLAECLTLCREIGDLTNGVYVLEVFGHLAEERAQWERAARLYAAGARLRGRLGTPMTEQGRKSQQERLATLRDALGSAPFEAAWQIGTAADLEQSIAFALEAVPPDAAFCPAQKTQQTA